MLGIGEFAFQGHVSVRMLRHYDSLGLLVPAVVDPVSGYRRYSAEQLGRLNRLVALKDLGFSLSQIGPILDAEVSAPELAAMLTLLRSQVESQIEADQARLAEIERRLRSIEQEHTMSELDFTTTSLPELRLAQRTATVADVTEIGGVIGPMFEDLLKATAAAGLDPDAPSIAWYDISEDSISFGAGMPLARPEDAIAGFDAETLPAAPRAVRVTHRGSLDALPQTWQALIQHVGSENLSPTGLCREVYLDTPLDRPDEWVIELQQPVQ